MPIILSPKHGVNPSVGHCPICGKECSVILFGRMKDDAEAPRDVQNGLCNECEDALNAGAIMLIEVRDGESGNNPYRTGYIAGLKREACEKIFTGVDFEKNRIMFIEESTLKTILGDMYKKEVKES